MSNYWNMREAKVNIAHELMNRGWKVYGYHADNSDSMTDYFDPACWLDGIATKNGFILVVDNDQDSKGREITKYNPKGHLTPENQEKIKKLEMVTQEHGATPGEERNAKEFIKKIQSKISGASQYVVVGHVPAHMGNPGKCKWHIEKDGKIYDKGTGITKYSKVPAFYEFDLMKMEFKPGHDKWFGGEKKVLTDEEKKAVNDFKNLILRFERVINNMNSCGDGTTETEQAGLEQQAKEGFEKVTVKETKTRLKMVEVERKNIKLGDYLTFNYHGGYWKVVNEYMQKGTWKGVQMEKNAFVYEIVGKESRGFKSLKNAKRYYQYEERLLKEVENGTTKIYELKEVEVIEEIEKWVKIDNKKTNVKKQEKKEQPKEPTQKEANVNSIINHEITITADTDTRDNSALWVVKIIDKLSKEEYIQTSEQFKALKGYYSKFKHGFIFKYDPTSVLKGEQEQTQEQQEPSQTEPENPYKPEEIQKGFLYNCHFKEWDYTIQQIKEQVTALKIPFLDYGEKIGFKGLTPKQAEQVKTISNSNGSIFFIDGKIKIADIEQTAEEAEQQAETLLDLSTSIIIELNITNLSMIELNQDIKEQYINKLTEAIKEYNIHLTVGIISHLIKNEYYSFVDVLALVSMSMVTKAEQVTTNINNQRVTDSPEQQEDQSKYIERIDKTIESNNKKIERLSGDYLTNTPKRAREQANRYDQKEKFQQDNSLLEYLKEKAEENSLTEFEKALTVNKFREEIRSYYIRKTKYKHEIKFPYLKPDVADGWYNLEVPKMQKRLQKANINNTFELLTAIEGYHNIITAIEQPKNPIIEQIKQKERELKFCKIPGYFPTPKNIVKKMIEQAEVTEWHNILEPSAGNGNIADMVTEQGFKCDCIEWNYSLNELLKLKGHNVVADDFLIYSNYNKYDRIIMNPPFEGNSDIKHVKHAYKMLKNNGRIVAIMSPHFTFADDKESREFREWISNRGYYERLPEGSFKDSGTNVNTVLVVIDKLEDDMSQVI